MVPLGDPMVPLGDPMVPLGDPMAPLGDPMVPLGDPMLPLGDPMLPLGDPMFRMNPPGPYKSPWAPQVPMGPLRPGQGVHGYEGFSLREYFFRIRNGRFARKFLIPRSF